MSHRSRFVILIMSGVTFGALLVGAPGVALAQETDPAPAVEKPTPSDEGGALEAPPKAGEPGATRELPGLQRSGRMEFDARLIRGETPKAGAVYLFKRARRRLPMLVDQRRSYLDDMVEPVLGRSPRLQLPAARDTTPPTVVLTEEQKNTRAAAKAAKAGKDTVGDVTGDEAAPGEGKKRAKSRVRGKAKTPRGTK